MTMTVMTTNAQRIGKVKGEILAEAEAVSVMTKWGRMFSMKKNSGKQIVFRRYIPYGATTTSASTQNRPSVTANAHITQEGVAPIPDTLTPVDMTWTLQQYAALYELSDQVYDLYEDDVEGVAKRQIGNRMTLLREMICYGGLKAGTNLFYSGGTTRATVDEAISLNFLRRMTRNLKSNHGQMVTKILSASTSFNTAPVEAAYVVFCHTDCEQDIRDLPKFIHVAEYGQRKVLDDHEIGSCEGFRFILSPELGSIINSGAAVGSTGLVSAGASQVDVYPVIVCAEDAWGQLTLKGAGTFDVKVVPHDKPDHYDPLGMFGYVGAKFYFAADILNNGWLAIGETGVSTVN